MIRRALIVDTETTGLDPKTGVIIEIGAILYDVANLTRLVCLSTLIKTDKSNDAIAINRISRAALQQCPISRNAYGAAFAELADLSDVIVAHGADFDRSFLGTGWGGKPWACTRMDFKWPTQTREGQSLVTLALDHGIGVSSAHRALTDCSLIADLFDRMPLFGEDLQEMFVRAMRPKAMMRALVPFELKDLAKDAGFEWDKPGREKVWSRTIAIEDAAALPFKTSIMWDIK